MLYLLNQDTLNASFQEFLVGIVKLCGSSLKKPIEKIKYMLEWKTLLESWMKKKKKEKKKCSMWINEV